jgi:hypothetical protein
MHDMCFAKHFQAPNNTAKYDGKTNPSIWLEDYCLACKAGGADNDLFIIQLLTIYLADTSRAWLDHLPKYSIDCCEDLKEIFTGNFQGAYVRPSNPSDLKGCRQKQGNPCEITSSVSPESVTNSPRSVMPTSSQRFGPSEEAVKAVFM